MKKLILAIAIATLAACVVAPHSASVYQGRDTQNEQSVRMATVESVRDVTIDNRSTGTGTMAGAALGGLAAGSNIGGGNGSAAAAVLGAVAGGLVGQNVEANMMRKKGLEITVRLENGELRAITQDADEAFHSGDRVRLLSNGRTTRVTH